MNRKQLCKLVLAVALLMVGVPLLSGCNSPQAQQALKKAIEQGSDFCYVDFGIYRPSRDYDVGAYPGQGPRGIAADDFDKDGNLDLVTANFDRVDDYSSSMTVLMGNGRGEFPGRTEYPGYKMRYGLMAVDTGDLNGDGNADIVMAARWYPAGSQDRTIVLAHGNGDGTFEFYRDPRVLDYSVYVEVADMNNDGFLDVVVTYWELGAVTVLLSKGPAAHFEYTQVDTYIAGIAFPRSLAVGDFNQDGISDVALAPNVGGLVVLPGKGDGNFWTPEIIDLDGWLSFVITADLNGDRLPDLAVSSTRDPNNVVYVMYGNGDGTFREPIESMVGAGPKGLGGLGAGDMDKLGNYDVMVVNSADDSVTGLFDTGLGFRTARTYPVGIFPSSLVTGDFDHNGLTDVAVTNTGMVDDWPTDNTTVTVLLADYVCLPR